MSASALLVMDRVGCVRGGRLLFDSVNLTLVAGEAVLVTGANGAGKSSLLRLVAGLLRPSRGTVERAATIGLSDETAALDERSTLGSALGFWARIDGVEAAHGIEAMGLEQLLEVPVRMLSSGQRKRATLARVIASRATLWLLDEPANGLDAEALRLLGAAMTDHRRSGGGILAASHQPLELEAAATISLGAA